MASSTPAAGDGENPGVESLGGGIHSITVPIPGSPLGYTLVYLLESDRGPVLVDAGWQDPAAWETLVDGIAATGHRIDEVHGVLVTHHHPDHHGLAGPVRDESGAWIAMHPADIRLVRMQRDALQGGAAAERRRERMMEGLHMAGAPRDEVAAMSGLPDLDPPAVPDVELVDGERVQVPGRRLWAVWTPGHSPGHTCFHVDEAGAGPDAAGGRDALLAGDHLLPGITPHVGLYEPERDDDPLGDFLVSLARIAELAPREVLPAHQHRFTDPAGRAEEILDHHEDHFRRILAGIGDGGATVWEIARGMEWNAEWNELSDPMRRIAVSEAAAHARHLAERGDLTAVDGTTPVRLVPT